MSNYTSLNLYLVSEGDVAPAGPETTFDGINSLLVAASSRTGALEVAEAFDRGEIAVDNLAWSGNTIACATLRDPATGDYR